MSHEPLGGQDPTLIPAGSGAVYGAVYRAVCALGCLCPTPSPSNLIMPPHLPFSSLQGV